MFTSVPFRQLKRPAPRFFRKSPCNLIPRIESLLPGEVRFDSLLDLVKVRNRIHATDYMILRAESG